MHQTTEVIKTMPPTAESLNRRLWTVNNLISRSGIEGRNRNQTILTYHPFTREQQAALMAVKEAIRLWKDDHSGFLFHGPDPGPDPLNPIVNNGTGKSHLGKAYLLALIDKYLIEAKYFKVQNLLDIEEAAKHSALRSEIIELKYTKPSIVMLDELDKADIDPRENRKGFAIIYHLVDYLFDQGIPLVITTNLTPDEIKRWLGSSFASRISNLRKVLIMGPDGRRKEGSNAHYRY